MRSAKIPAILLLILGACAGDGRMALGNVNSVIVVAEDSLWADVQDTVLRTLQPRVFADRDEPTFQLTHVSPRNEDWLQLRRFRQVLALGQPGDPWVAAALEAADSSPAPPAIVEAQNVWARSQQVTAVVLPAEGSAESVRSLAVPLHQLLDRRYRDWARARMYTSGHDEALADTLRRQAAFTLDLPQVYRWQRVGDSAYMFLNDQPDASQLVRSVLVTWRADPQGRVTVEDALAWRDSVAARFYDWGQTTEREPLQTSAVDAPGGGGFEARGIWTGTLEDFPQAGPFITRVVDCPSQDRRYLLDAWLYAPSRDKYQYMIQLETLLDSFGCGSG